MLDLMRFIFSSFWVFAGTVILLSIGVSALAVLAKTIIAIIAVIRGGDQTINIK